MSARTLGLALVGLNGLVALAFGFFGLIAPADLAESVRLAPENAFGTGEISALYGGMWTAMGIVVLTSLLALARDPFALAGERVRTIAWCWVGLPVGRGLGAATHGSDGGPTLLFLIAELLMIGTLLIGLTLLQRPRA